MEITKIFQYPKGDGLITVQNLIFLSHGNILYKRYLNSDWFENPRTFSFIRIINSRGHEADLIVQSKNFNISSRVGEDKYVLCSNYVREYSFILLFADKTNADNFYAAVERDLDRTIICSDVWITSELLQVIDLPEFPALPLPYT